MEALMPTLVTYSTGFTASFPRPIPFPPVHPIIVMLLTCKTILEYQICEEIYPEHRIVRNNIKYFIIQKAMFTCLFEGVTFNRAELDYKIKHDAPRRESLSFIYDSYMQYHGAIPWFLLIPSI